MENQVAGYRQASQTNKEQINGKQQADSTSLSETARIDRMQETLKLIATIRKNARASISKISRNTGMPISTVYDRLKRYNEGIIKKYTATVDFANLGYNAHACILLKVAPAERLKFQEYMLNCSHLNSFFKINNGFDFYLEFVFSSLREFEEYLDALECRFRILEKHTFYIVNELKREQFLSNPQLVMIKGEP